MQQYLAGHEKQRFQYDSNVVSATFRTDTGLLAGADLGVATKTGWYERGNMPSVDTSPPVASQVESQLSSEQHDPEDETSSGNPESSQPEESSRPNDDNSEPHPSSKPASEPAPSSRPSSSSRTPPVSSHDENGLPVPPDTDIAA